MLAVALLLALAQDRASMVPGPEEDAPPPPARCQSAPDEITVCGNPDQSRFRLTPLEPRYKTGPPRAQFTLPGGGTASVDATRRGAGGASVPAAMLTLRIPLGGKKNAQAPEKK
jgi:hypothetical protein